MLNYPNNPNRQWKNKILDTVLGPVKKFNNEEVIEDGIKFDSKGEHQINTLLNQLLKANKIKTFDRQVKYELQESFTMTDETKKQGYRTNQAITYTCDFKIIDNYDQEYIIDYKGSKATRTESFEIKRKLFEYKYEHPLHIVYNQGDLIELLNIK